MLLKPRPPSSSKSDDSLDYIQVTDPSTCEKLKNIAHKPLILVDHPSQLAAQFLNNQQLIKDNSKQQQKGQQKNKLMNDKKMNGKKKTKRQNVRKKSEKVIYVEKNQSKDVQNLDNKNIEKLRVAKIRFRSKQKRQELTEKNSSFQILIQVNTNHEKAIRKACGILNNNGEVELSNKGEHTASLALSQIAQAVKNKIPNLEKFIVFDDQNCVNTIRLKVKTQKIIQNVKKDQKEFKKEKYREKIQPAQQFFQGRNQKNLKYQQKPKQARKTKNRILISDDERDYR